MFGYVRPVKSELLVKDAELYSAIYCGLCRRGGKTVSRLTRWLLNYDFVLLAALRISLSGEGFCVENKRCPYKLKKKKCVCAEKSFDHTASAFGLFAYGKLLDNINDEKGLKKLGYIAVKPIFKRMAKRADRGDGLKEIIEKGLYATADAESRKVASIDEAADGFAFSMKGVAALGLDGDEKIIAEECGYHIGRFVYIADALDDVFDDEKSGSYNPLLLKYGSADEVVLHTEEIKTTLVDSLNAFSNAYAVKCGGTLEGLDRIIFNISELGGRAALGRITEKNEKRKNKR